MLDAKKRHKNLFMSWVDFRKAYDSVPHDWIIQCLKLFGVHGKLVGFLNNSMKLWKTVLTCNNEVLRVINIKRGIFQGDSLSPLLFVLALMPLSIVLRNINKGYVVHKDLQKVNHLLYLDDIKLYAKSRPELESLLHSVEIFSTDICMAFGFEKCKTLSVARGKFVDGLDISLLTGQIKHLDVGESYRYLGILEAEVVYHDTMKKHIVAKYKRRVRKILSSYLNSGNAIVAINSCAVPILRYSAGLVDWTQAELYKLDVTTRKLFSLHKAFNINSDVDRLYVHRLLGGRGLLSIADTVQRECNSLGYYLTQSSEPILHLISEHGWFSSEEPKVCKSLIQDGHMSAWMGKALHGRFLETFCHWWT